MISEAEIEYTQEFILFVFEMFPQLVHIQDEETVRMAVLQAAEVWLHAEEYASDDDVHRWQNTAPMHWNLPPTPVITPIPEEEVQMG